MSVSDRRVSYAPLDWSNSYVCVTVLHFERKPDMSKFKEESWQKAFKAVKEQFELESLLPEQENSLKEFLEGRNVFVNLPTGYGKSLIFQCLTIAADALLDKPRGSSLVIVISPLRSLMEDQVLFLNNTGVPAIAITDEGDPDIVQQVINGNYIVVYGSPECLLSTATWRSIFSCNTFVEMLIGVAIDEAHCITQWYVSYSLIFFLFNDIQIGKFSKHGKTSLYGVIHRNVTSIRTTCLL